MQTQKVKISEAECRNPKCNGKKKVKDFSSKTISWNKVLVCKSCWYYNSSELFFKYKKIQTKPLVFWVDLPSK